VHHPQADLCRYGLSGTASEAVRVNPSLVIKYQDLIELQEGTLARWQVARTAQQVARTAQQVASAVFSAHDLSVHDLSVHQLRAIDGLVRRGRWHSLYRGVYWTYGGKPSRTSLHWAALLRCGPDAVLSGRPRARKLCARPGFLGGRSSLDQLGRPCARKARGGPGSWVLRERMDGSGGCGLGSADPPPCYRVSRGFLAA
jgi:hypothetical protein